MSLSIRPARPGDAALVLAFVRELAAYEKLQHEVEATEAMIDAALFGDGPRAFCDIAEWGGEPVGFALWFLNFSSFRGRCGIYLEDLFVRPSHRGRGIGHDACSKASGGSNGRSSTGTRRRSPSTRRKARRCCTSGRSAASLARRWRSSPARSEDD